MAENLTLLSPFCLISDFIRELVQDFILSYFETKFIYFGERIEKLFLSHHITLSNRIRKSKTVLEQQWEEFLSFSKAILLSTVTAT